MAFKITKQYSVAAQVRLVKVEMVVLIACLCDSGREWKAARTRVFGIRIALNLLLLERYVGESAENSLQDLL